MQTKLVYPAFSLVCLIFGTTFLAIRVGVSGGASPFLFAGIRFTIAGILLALMMLALRRIRGRELLRLWPRAALVSVFYIVGNFGAQFWSLRHLGSGTGAQFQATTPVWTSILAALVLRQRLKPLHFLGLAAGLAGVFLVARGSLASTDPEAPLAAAVMVGGSLSFAIGTILFRRFFGEKDDPFAVNALNMLSGGLMLLALSALAETRSFPLRTATLIPLAYLTLVGSIVGHSSNLYVVKRAGPVFASSWLFVSPALATIAGALILGEAVPAAAIAGTLASFAGIAAMAAADRGPGLPETQKSA